MRFYHECESLASAIVRKIGENARRHEYNVFRHDYYEKHMSVSVSYV